ncbi:hypothetical protein [Clostridium sp. AM58-1XD]|uniref:hypothetical protein n=1 Tax=Clostridium sp. AM58-1XD TaxID=2292307 RepID=UPI000E50854D|nr:hypothetical protein [Clostridium sp. AM58-1XD]RGZ00899.1 hypothetical protein DXA13_03145 [Clostridium sp. AM58-1XD]
MERTEFKPDIIGIGESDVDLFLRVKRMPGKGEKIRAEEIGKMPGLSDRRHQGYNRSGGQF